MSTMPATHGHSEACCNQPPVVASGYEAKGSYATIHDLKTYATGPDDATKGIVVIYDIFGFKDQTLQGADILATTDETKYKVLVPDWFVGAPAALEIFPPDTPEKQTALTNFLGAHPPPATAAQLPAFVAAARAQYPSITQWAVVGFCWGGKVVSLVTAADANPFSVGAAAHPAMVDPKDALGIKVPIALLASKDEPIDDVTAWKNTLKVPHHVEVFEDQIHGWMAARANLADKRVQEEYARGYQVLLSFFAKHLA